MPRPNILIVYTDQQRRDALAAAAGNDEIVTPNLDALFRAGVAFDRCFVQNPVCMPSRVSFLSGRYPSNLGITRMGVPVPEDLRCLQHLLGDAGYRTANIGKLHFLPHANRDHRMPHPRYGFDHLQISDEPGMYEDAYRAWVRARFPEELDKISFGRPPMADVWVSKAGMRDDRVVHQFDGERSDFKHVAPHRARWDATHSAFVGDQTVEFIEGSAGSGQPFFCIAGFYSPHSPFYVPQRFLERYDRDALSIPEYPPHLEAVRAERGFHDDALRAAKHGYYALITEVDHWVGEILAALERTGRRDDTVIVFTADHGEHLGDHLRWAKGYPAQDSCSGVPLLVSWPGGFAGEGRVIGDLVEALDVFPTLCEAAMVQPPPDVNGRSLMPYLRGDAPEHPRASALTEGDGWRCLRTDRFRYLAETDGSERLWDLEREPSGDTDVHDDPAYADDLARMRRELIGRMLDAERPLPRTWPY